MNEREQAIERARELVKMGIDKLNEDQLCFVANLILNIDSYMKFENSIIEMISIWKK